MQTSKTRKYQLLPTFCADLAVDIKNYGRKGVGLSPKTLQHGTKQSDRQTVFVRRYKTSGVQRFLFTTCTTLHKKMNIKNEKGGGHRIYNPRGLRDR